MPANRLSCRWIVAATLMVVAGAAMAEAPAVNVTGVKITPASIP